MRLAILAVCLVCLAGCKKKQPAATDAAALAQIFADTPDAATADPSDGATASTDEPLPSLKPVALPPPVIAKPKASGSAAASAAGNPNLPQCVTAHAYCAKNHPDCENKKAACVAAGGRF
jgi:hypothetical protein